ncbi:MAG: hypothetical protein GX799_05420 [Crenarchaeota archaeon]|nr:hypothetical protein [Thermoproteota archaeon]
MNKTVSSLILLLLVATAILLIISCIMSKATLPSPFLIAATIVSMVALCGAIFSLYVENKTKRQC